MPSTPITVVVLLHKYYNILTRPQTCKKSKSATDLTGEANTAQGGVQRHLPQPFAEAWRDSILRLWLWLEARKRRNLHLRPVTDPASAVEPSITRIRSQDSLAQRRRDTTRWLQAGGFRPRLQSLQDLVRHRAGQPGACAAWLELGKGRLWEG